MKFSISNLAWEKKDEPNIFNYLKSINITGIEVSLTQIWPNWEGLNYNSALEYKKYLETYGLKVAAIQAIFYQKNFRSLFNESDHVAILSHLKFISDLAEILNCEVIVLGAPKSRIINELNILDDLMNFNKLINKYICNSSQTVKLCIEALGSNYGNVFIKNHYDLIKLIKTVDNEKLGFHVDSATLESENENFSDLILNCPRIDHFHISESNLKEYNLSIDRHIENLSMLEKIKYQKWCSFELVKPEKLLEESGISEITSYFDIDKFNSAL